MHHQIYFAVLFFPPSRNYPEHRTKSSAVTFPLKPLQSSSTCVSELPVLKEKHLVSRSHPPDSAPVSRGDQVLFTTPTLHPPTELSYSGYIKLISCENPRLGCIKRTVNQRQQTWQTLLDACQIFARILQYSFWLLLFTPQKYHPTVAWDLASQMEEICVHITGFLLVKLLLFFHCWVDCLGGCLFAFPPLALLSWFVSSI